MRRVSSRGPSPARNPLSSSSAYEATVGPGKALLGCAACAGILVVMGCIGVAGVWAVFEFSRWLF